MIPQFLLKNTGGGKLDHLRKTKGGYIADSYFLDVDWFVNFKFLADILGYEIIVSGHSRYDSHCLEIKITKKQGAKL